MIGLGQLGAIGRLGNTRGKGVGVPLGPIAWVSGVPNEFGTPGSVGGLGASNKQVGSTTHFCFYEDLADGSFRIAFWNGAATQNHGEWSAGAAASMKASVRWIDQNKAVHTTQLVGADLASTTISVPDGQLGWFFGPTIRGLVGSHAWVKFWGNFPNGGFYSHGKADYANGEELVYGATVTDHTGDFASYGNTYTGVADHYGPVFIGGHVQRPTFFVDGDSREGGVATPTQADVPNKLSGGHGTVNRYFLPSMAGVDISIPGASAQEMADQTKTPIRDSLAKMAGPKAVRMDALGVNDTIFTGRTSTQMLADAATRAARLGLKTYPVTLSPVVTDATHNTVYSSGNDPQRIAVNVARRAMTGVFDPALVLESTGTPGTVKTLADMFDGTHQNATGNEDVHSNAGYDIPGNFGSAAQPINFGFQYAASPLYQSLDLASGWTTQQTSLSADQVYSPDHKMTAAILKEDATASARHTIYVQPTLTLASTTKTFTAFAKQLTGARSLMLQVQNSSTFTDSKMVVNLSTGAEEFSFGGTGVTVAAHTVTAVEDYYKIVFSLTFAAGYAANPYVYLAMYNDTANNDSYNGDNTSSLVLWGFDIR